MPHLQLGTCFSGSIYSSLTVCMNLPFYFIGSLSFGYLSVYSAEFQNFDEKVFTLIKHFEK